jgi:hypothetical protein
MKRVGALLGAIAMIALAVVIRGAIDGDSGGGGSSGGGPVRLLCITEVEAACEALAADNSDVQVTIERAGDTVAGATDTDPQARSAYDAWVTLQPLPEMANLLAERPVFDEGEVVAASRVVLVAPSDRAEALISSCGESSTSESEDLVAQWRCVGDTAGQRWSEYGGEQAWGVVKPGLRDPEETASGLMALSQLAEGWFAEEEIGSDFASNDFDAAFGRWLSDIRGAQPNTSGDPLTVLVQQGPAAFGWVIALEADYESTVVGSREEDDLRVLYPAPMARAAVVLAPRSGAPNADAAADLADELSAALGDTGWNTDDLESSGLPGAGNSIALQELWG